MKKNTLLLLLLITLAFMACKSTKQAATPEAEIGQAFVAALAQQDVDAVLALLMDAASARATMEKIGEPQAEIEAQLAGFEQELPKMEANMRKAFAYFQKELGSKGITQAKFDKTAFQEGESMHDKVDKRDLHVYFHIGDDQYIADLDDCVKTVNGWKMTGKFNIHGVQK